MEPSHERRGIGAPEARLSRPEATVLGGHAKADTTLRRFETLRQDEIAPGKNFAQVMSGLVLSCRRRAGNQIGCSGTDGG